MLTYDGITNYNDYVMRIKEIDELVGNVRSRAESCTSQFAGSSRAIGTSSDKVGLGAVELADLKAEQSRLVTIVIDTLVGLRNLPLQVGLVVRTRSLKGLTWERVGEIAGLTPEKARYVYEKFIKSLPDFPKKE